MKHTEKEKGNSVQLVKDNLSLRLLTSLIFVPFFLLLYDYGSIPFLFFTAGMIAVMSYEFFMILKAKGLEPYFKIGVVSSVVLAFTAYFSSALFTHFVITSLIILLSVSELTRKKRDNLIMHISSTVFGVIYTGWMGGHILLLRHLSGTMLNSSILVLFALYMIWMADTGAFFAGSLFGKHKIMPRISPSKSYEGLIGGIVFSILSGFAFRFFWARFLSVPDIIFIGLIGSLGGLAGDLVESAMKRDAELKDVSSFLPGHGGVLDRFDSVLFALPLIYYYFMFFLSGRMH